jgi:hypothetical protein
MSNVPETLEHKAAPIITRRIGSLEIAIFEWESEDKRVSHSTRLTYSFRRKNSNTWETSEFLPTSELLAAAKLFDLAHTAIMERLASRQ